MEEDLRCHSRPVFIVPVVIVIVPGGSPVSPGRGGRLVVKAAGWGDVPWPGDLLSHSLKSEHGLRGQNGGSSGGGGGSADRVDERELHVRPGQDVSGGSPLHLTSSKGFAWGSIERLSGADILTGLIGGCVQGCLKHSNDNRYSNRGDSNDRRGMEGSS